MKSIIQHLREEKNLTQTELAEKSGLSLRTIQRIEAGNVPKGYTLKALAFFFETEPEKLIPNKVILNVERAKLINISSLAGLIIPFGGVILPLILTYKTKDQQNKELGKNMVSLQILIAGVFGNFSNNKSIHSKRIIAAFSAVYHSFSHYNLSKATGSYHQWQ